MKQRQWNCTSLSDLPFSTRAVTIAFPGILQNPVRLFECADGAAADDIFVGLGEEDSTGAKIWPLAHACASKLLTLGVKGRSVLELGCGCGVISLAAKQAGAAFVMATDRSIPNLQLVSFSASLIETGGNFTCELFDVSLDSLPLPRAHEGYCGNSRIGPYRASCESRLPDRFDYVAFSDTLYEAESARDFGARAAQALALGSTVIIADTMREWLSFYEGLKSEANQLNTPLPPVIRSHVDIPASLYDWCCAETADVLELYEPWILVLSPPASQDVRVDAAIRDPTQRKAERDVSVRPLKRTRETPPGD